MHFLRDIVKRFLEHQVHGPNYMLSFRYDYRSCWVYVRLFSKNGNDVVAIILDEYRNV